LSIELLFQEPILWRTRSGWGISITAAALAPSMAVELVVMLFQRRHDGGAGGTWAYPCDLVAVACWRPRGVTYPGSGAVLCGDRVRDAPGQILPPNVLTEDEKVLC
jgi:hypothetical protein